MAAKEGGCGLQRVGWEACAEGHPVGLWLWVPFGRDIILETWLAIERADSRGLSTASFGGACSDWPST